MSLAYSIIEKNRVRKFKHAGYIQPVQDRYGLLQMKPGDVRSVREDSEPEKIEYRRWAIVNSGAYYRKTGRTKHRFWTKVVSCGPRVYIEYGIRVPE